MKLKNLLNFCWLSIFFDILIAYISWMVARTPINHTIFWKSVMRISRRIYVSCFNRLRFLAEVSTKLQKIHFFEQFMDHNSGRKHGNLKNDPIFLSTFSALFVTFIFVFETSQNSFSFGLPFDLFWSVKYLNLGQKLPIRATHHTFLESRHPEVTKNPYLWFVPRGEPKKVSAHGI